MTQRTNFLVQDNAAWMRAVAQPIIDEWLERMKSLDFMLFRWSDTVAGAPAYVTPGKKMMCQAVWDYGRAACGKEALPAPCYCGNCCNKKISPYCEEHTSLLLSCERCGSPLEIRTAR